VEKPFLKGIHKILKGFSQNGGEGGGGGVGGTECSNL
jgi:hypothetical protein